MSFGRWLLIKKKTMKRTTLLTILLLCSMMSHAQPASAPTDSTQQAQQAPRRRHPWHDPRHPDVHDPVMARGEDGRYYLFATGMGVSVLSSSDMK